MPDDRPAPDRPARIGQIAIAVADLDRAAAWYADVLGLPLLFRARGANLVDDPHLIARMPDHDLWMAFCHDSEGNLLGLMSEVRPPAA